MPSELPPLTNGDITRLAQAVILDSEGRAVGFDHAEVQRIAARIRDEAVEAAERALRERVEAVIEAKSFLGSFGESGPYIAVTDVRAAVAAGSSPSEETCQDERCEHGVPGGCPSSPSEGDAEEREVDER